MRKFLLASVATLGAVGVTGAAFAQAPVPSVTEGQVISNPTGGPSYVNNNNNYQAAALPGPVATPTPGTIVIHVNGKVAGGLRRDLVERRLAVRDGTRRFAWRPGPRGWRPNAGCHHPRQ